MLVIRYRLNVYFAIISLVVLLPINFKNSIINHIYFFSFRLDYIFHSLLFLPWFFLKPKKIDKPFMWFLIGLILGVSIECLQYMVPYRTFNLKDLFANFSGVCVGTIFGLLLELVKKRSKTISE